MKDAHCMQNTWVSLRKAQVITDNKVVNEKEQLERLEEEEEERKKVQEMRGMTNNEL
jgi:hypothetical protein